MKLTLTILSFLFFSINTYCQTNTNTMLWRISGKGLTKPSYVFGTIHLNDKRVFLLGDSLYRALETTEGFAGELDMNRVGNEIFSYFMDQKEAEEESPLISEVVDRDVWEKYKKKLEKQIGKPADEITLDDLDAMDNRFETELLKRGDMPTFLDAYLFGLARDRGNWVGGLEELKDQMDHFSPVEVEEQIQTTLYTEKYYRHNIEWLIRTYNAQALDSIDAYMFREESGLKDPIMIRRNLKMTRGMDSLSAIRSTLFAVGAAHLPGDSGVISLLRARGFTVTPVFSSKKIKPEKYDAKKVEMPWHPVAVSNDAYKLQMPGVSNGVPQFESMGLDMRFYFDVSAMRVFMTMNIELGESRRKLGIDGLLNSLKKEFTKKGKIKRERKVTVNNQEGREFVFSTPEGEFVMQAFVPDLSICVVNGVFGLNDQSIGDKDAENFFHSFTYNTDRVKPTFSTSDWKMLTSDKHFFSIDIPKLPKEKIEPDAGTGRVSYSYNFFDPTGIIFYVVNIHTVKEGMYDTGSDSSLYDAMRERLTTNIAGGEILDSAMFTINNYPAMRFHSSGKTEEGMRLEIITLVVTRGNRQYSIVATFERKEELFEYAERFVKSFKLLPYEHPGWKSQESADGSFTVQSAFPLRSKELEEGDIHPSAKRFIIHDSVVATTLYIDKTILPDWYWNTSDTAFLRKRSGQYKSYLDSIADYTVTRKGNMQVADFLVVSEGDHRVKRVKMILNGNELYEIFGTMAKHDLRKEYTRFFDGFRINKDVSYDKLTEPKTAAFIDAILKADSKEDVDVINEWWDDLKFTKEDLPLLRPLLLKKLPDYDSTFYNSINRKVYNIVQSLDSTEATVNYIRENYAKISATDEYVKPHVIYYLSAKQTKNSYDLLKDVLVKYSLNLGKETYITHSLYDSIELTANLYPEAMKLAEHPAMNNIIWGVTTYLLDSNYLSEATIKQYAKHFINAASQLSKLKEEDIINEYYWFSDLFRALGIIATPESNAILKKFLAMDNRSIRYEALIALMKAGQPGDKKSIYTFATTDEYRHPLYDELKKMGQLKLFPKEYMTQRQLAQSKVYSEAMDEENENPPVITFVKEKVIDYKGKAQKFYLFKVYLEDYEQSYLGIAGPYPTDSHLLDSSHDSTGVYWEFEFDPTKLDEFLENWLKEGDEKEDE